MWAKRCTTRFTKKVRRMLYEETDNLIWSCCEKEIAQWCKRNVVYDEIAEQEIEEVWRKEDPSDDEPIRLNGKYVWGTAKVMLVIKEANNVERKRRQTARKERSEEAATRTQKAKAMISNIKRGGMRKEEIERMLEKILGKGSGQEIENVNTMEKITERIEELSRREEQLEVWDKT